MESFSRRSFLRNGSYVVVGAGVASAAPALAPALGKAAAAAPVERSDSVASPPHDAKLETPLVAHVEDLHTGEIGVYHGTTKVTFRDPQLAARLFGAVR